MKTFEKITPYVNDDYCFWISGIYKIVSYRKGEYYAFFIQEWAKNWGDYVSKPPHISDRGNRCWLTLDAAIDACKTHSKQYEPSASIKRRAAEILNSYREAA